MLEPGRSWRSEPCSCLDEHSCRLLAAAPELPFFPKEGRSGRGAGARLGQSPPPPRRSRPRSPRLPLAQPRASPAIAPCPLSPSHRFCTRGLLALLADTSFTGRRGFSPRYSMCFRESCNFFCSEESFVGEGKPPYRGASCVLFKRPDCTAMPLPVEFVSWAGRCFPMSPDASFCKDTLILTKYPPAENTAHSGYASVDAACELMVVPATWPL